MAKFKCKMCGAPLDVTEGQTVATCSFCGSKQTVANADDERKEALFNRANSLRAACDFDKAILSYQSILSIFPSEPEAHWGLCLCKYGIEYVDDPASKKKIPTIHRVSFDSILKDSDYLAALSYADVIAKEQYQEEAKQIAAIQQNILSISQKEEPFDIFICYKETNEQGKRTPDSVMAQEIYSNLTDRGYKVFFSRITLENKLGTMYEPYIFAALSSAKIMLCIGTKKEYFEAIWVKNEWSRFIDMMRTRPDRYLIPCYRDMDAYEMPEQFLAFQAQDLAKLGFMQDLTRGIDKIMGRNEQIKPQTETKIIQTDVNVAALLTRAEILIGDEAYEKADELLERVLDNDPKNSQAYLLKLLIELQVTSIDDLKQQKEELYANRNYMKAYDFGDDAQKARLSAINEFITNRKEEERLDKIYNLAIDYKAAKRYVEAEQTFSSIAGYRDANQQALECVNLGKEEIYTKAVNLKSLGKYIDAIEVFNKVIDYKDSEFQIKECKELEHKGIYGLAMRNKECGQYDAAISLFMQILSYNDSNFQVDECERLKTEAKKEAVYVTCVFNREINPYFDSSLLKQACQKLATIPGYKDADMLLAQYEGILKDYEAELARKREEAAREKAIRQKKIKKVSLISVGSALGLTAVLLLTFLFLVPQGRQGKIQKLIDSGDYETAIQLLDKNDDYGDSDKLRLMSCAGLAFESLNYELGIDYVQLAGGTVDVAYDTNGGDAANTSESISGRRTYITNRSDKNGYSFFGWRLADYSLTSKKHYAAIQLTAQYDVITYNISYVLNGGEASNLPSSYNTEETVSIPNPTKEGYTFLGWTTYDNQTPQPNYVIQPGSIGNIRLTANWEANNYTIHLDPNGGTVSDTSVSVTYDKSYLLPTPEYNGYDFEGWYDENGTKYRTGTYKIAGDLYLTARWQTHDYSITYNLNGGTNADVNPSTYTIETSTITLQDPYRLGYTFTGWTTSGVTTPTKGLKIEKGTTGNLSYTANWSNNTYNVAIDSNGGSISQTSYQFTYDQHYAITEPTRVGYTLDGFDYNGTTISSSGTWNIASDATLVARWIANTNTAYKINYYTENLSGGGYSLNSTSNFEGTSDDEITVYPKTIEGFTPSVSSQTVSVKPDGSLVVDFYYSRNSYILSFASNGGTSVDSITMKYEEPLSSSIVTSRPGYTFEGWYKDIGQTDKLVTMPASDLTAQAYYSEETRASFFNASYYEGNATINSTNSVTGAVVIPSYINNCPVVELADSAFENCTSVTSIHIPTTVGALGASAFKNCTSLEKITGTQDITEIKESTFENCRVLSVFPDLSSVVSIGDNAFKDCVSLTTIEISNILERIGNYAFAGCVSLLQTPDMSNVTNIGNFAFKDCYSLTDIESLDGSATIGDAIFTACENIAKLSIKFTDLVEQFYVAKLFSNASDDSSKFYEATVDSQTLYIPNSLVELGYDGDGHVPGYFAYCLSSITKFTDLSSNIEYVGDYAFYNCTSLNEGVDVSNLLSIGDYAYKGVNIFTNLVISDECSHIGEGAFSGCSNITKVHLPFVGRDETGETDFGYIFGTENYTGSYAATENDVTYYIPNSLTEIYITTGIARTESLAGLNTIKKLTLSESVSSVKNQALSGMDSLEELSIPALTMSDTTEQDVFFKITSYGDEAYPWTSTNGIDFISTNKNASTSSTMSLEFKKSGTFSYKYRVSSRSGYDYIRIYKNGNSVNSLSGYYSSFYSNSITVSTGDIVTVSYSRSSYSSSNDNTAYFSLVSVPSTTVVRTQKNVFGNLFASKTITDSTKTGTLSHELVMNSCGEYSSWTNQWNSYDGNGSNSSNYLQSYYYNIPSTLKTVSITNQVEIPDGAFFNMKNVETINIADTATVIGKAAFAGCTSLSSINGAGINFDSVEEIKDYAFYQDTNLLIANFGDSLITIGEYALSKTNLVTFNANSSLQTIGVRSFEDCVALTEVLFTDEMQVSTIGAYAFDGCSLLSKINSNNENTYVLSDSIQKIGESALSRCNLVEDLTIPFVGTYDGSSNAFGIIFGTESYEGSYTVTQLSKTYCIPSNLTKLTIGGSVIAVGSCANLTSVKSLIVKDSVTSIGSFAFKGFNSLESITIPFVGQSENETNAIYQTFGYIFGYDSSSSSDGYRTSNATATYQGSSYAYYVPRAIMNVTITKQTTISNNAFRNCDLIEKITLSKDTSSIGAYAFYNCTSLKQLNSSVDGEFNIPQSVTTISNYSFSNCSLASTITLGNEVTSIGSYAFKGIALIKNIVIPDSVTSIGDYAFKECNSLESITLPFVGNNRDSTSVFSCLFSTVPSSLKEVTITDDISIPSSAFSSLKTIEKITIPENTETIGSQAFDGCTSLKQLNSSVDGEFNIPQSTTVINSYAFRNCSLASAITLGNEVTSIGSYAFAGCSMVTKFNSENSCELVVPSLCETIGSYAFQGMALITNVIVPDSVTSIGSFAFNGFNSLESIILPFVGASETATAYSAVFGYIFGYEAAERGGYIVSYDGATGTQYSDSCCGTYSTNFVNRYCLEVGRGDFPGTTWQYSAFTYPYNGVYYLYSWVYYIPESIKNVTITKQASIPVAAFNGCTTLESIHLVDCIDSIGDYAFQNCDAVVDYSVNPTKSVIWDGSLVATSFHGGTGTEQNPYQIFSPKEFIYFLNLTRESSYGTSYYKLTSDINLGNYTIDPIALTETNSFKANLDGNGFVVKNFKISQTDSSHIGLFCYFDGVLKNIGFENVSATYTTGVDTKFVGLIIGRLGGIVENVYATGTLSVTSSKQITVGGLVGYNSLGSVSNVYTNVSITAKATGTYCYAGGIIGSNNGSITNSFSYGNISSTGYAAAYSIAGRIVGGQGSDGSVTNCYAYSEQVVKQFDAVSNPTNSEGTSASLEEIIDFCKVNWIYAKWSYKKGLPAFIS